MSGRGGIAGPLLLVVLLIVFAVYCWTRAAVGHPLFGGPL